MSPNRRDFMKLAAGLGLAAAVPAASARASVPAAPPIDTWVLMGPLPLGKTHRTAGVSRMEWNPDHGWSMRLAPLCFDMNWLHDPDDTTGLIVADTYATPGDFLNAVVVAGIRPLATLERIELATDYRDFVDRHPSQVVHPPRNEPEEELLAWLNGSDHGQGFAIVDTRRSVSERRPWANAVVRPSGYGYGHLRYYARVRYIWE